MNKKSLIVFTDLDASLLNERYSYKAAYEALSELKKFNIPLIINSSKTISEIKDIREELGFSDAVIAENGSVIGIPNYKLKSSKNNELFIYYDDQINREFIISIIYNLRTKDKFLFEGFYDWNYEILSSKTGLNKANAKKAMNRYMTEPILWLDSDEKYTLFTQKIESKGLKSINGGRFKHIMPSSFDKGNALRKVLNIYKQSDPSIIYHSISLGDSENDIPMLKESDSAVILPNKNKSIEVIHSDLIISNQASSIGWNQEVLALLERFNITNNIGVL